uniref:Uncharacterized protein n=1 Tax=Tetranychus urticae TaxID=32264 RepID=T1L5B2_TETUR
MLANYQDKSAIGTIMIMRDKRD